MTSPRPDDQPTAVLPPQPTQEPTVPAHRRAGLWQHVPARIGRARTSTVVIGLLFVLLFALNTVLPSGEATSPVVLPGGQTIQVPNSNLPEDYVPPAPASGLVRRWAAPAPATSRAPQSGDGEDPTTTAATSRAPRSSSTPTTSRTPSSSRAPTTTADPSMTERAPASTASGTSAAPSS